MRDCFIEALDLDLALKLREKEVANLDQALSSALKLEAIHAAAAGRDKQSLIATKKGVISMHVMLLLVNVVIMLMCHCLSFCRS